MTKDDLKQILLEYTKHLEKSYYIEGVLPDEHFIERWIEKISKER